MLDEESIYNLFKDFKYVIPGGSVMATLGSDKLSSLSNCFVIDSPKDSISGIMNQLNNQSQLMKYRGGVGFDISTLRPMGSTVSNAAKTSTGAASFMDLFSNVTNTIAQNGRRGKPKCASKLCELVNTRCVLISINMLTVKVK